MASHHHHHHPLLLLLLLLLCISSFPFPSHQQPPLDPAEQEAVYAALDAVNSAVPWRTLFPDDLCLSAPHGILCDYITTANEDSGSSSGGSTTHVVELSFGFVGDYSPNPTCSPKSTFPLSAATLPYLRKLFFYRCFTDMPIHFPAFGSGDLGFSGLEELVFIENPALVGSINGSLGNLSRLRTLILSRGSNLTGGIPPEIGQLSDLQHLVISGTRLDGQVPSSLGQLLRLRVLDLSHNQLTGTIPESLGNLNSLLKLDMSWNGLVGRIPETLKGLQNVELLDLGHNQLGNFGIPVFIGKMPRLKEVQLSGNTELGGSIPEIWENLSGLVGIGFSGMGLTGEIPSSMGVHLRNLSYIALDNNKLEGTLPMELENLMGTLHEMNLENNNLSGRVPFSGSFVDDIGTKLRLGGNPELCVDKGILGSENKRKQIGSLHGFRTLRVCNGTENSNTALVNSGSCRIVVSWCLRLMIPVGYFGLYGHFPVL